MRFCVECTLLTDDTGSAVPPAHQGRVTYHVVDADTAAEAVRAVMSVCGDELIGRIEQVDDRQALATVRHGKSATMIHAYPEEEKVWRRAARK